MLARFTPPPTLGSSLPLAFPAMKWEQARWARELTLPDSSPQPMTDNPSPLSVEHLGGARWALSPRGFVWAYCQLSTVLHGVCPQSTVRRPDLVSVMADFSQFCLDTLRQYYIYKPHGSSLGNDQAEHGCVHLYIRHKCNQDLVSI